MPALSRPAKRLGIQVNDLYAVVMNAGAGKVLRDDGVHFTEAGSKLLGEAVANAIRKCASAIGAIIGPRSLNSEGVGKSWFDERSRPPDD